MKSRKPFLCAMCLGFASIAPTISAQETSEIPVPAKSLSCLIEHQEKYLSLPRQLIIFFADLCPAVSRDEVAAMVDNSAEVNGEQGQRLIMLKSDFRCLIDKIEAHMATSGSEDTTAAEDEPNGTIAFRLDCN